MKHTLKEAIIIIILSSLLGLVYNYFSSKPLQLLYTPKKLEVANDSMFNQLNISVEDTQSKSKSQQITKIDTIVPKKEKSTTSDTIPKQEKATISIVGSKIGAIKTVTLILMKKHLNDKNFLFVDARKPEDYLASHIGNSINIDPYEDNKDGYFRKLTSLPLDKIIVVYCSGGQCEASHHVVEDLVSFGYTKVFLFPGGWEEWTMKAKN